MTKSPPDEPIPMESAEGPELTPAAAAILRGVQRLLRAHGFEISPKQAWQMAGAPTPWQSGLMAMSG